MRIFILFAGLMIALGILNLDKALTPIRTLDFGIKGGETLTEALDRTEACRPRRERHDAKDPTEVGRN